MSSTLNTFHLIMTELLKQYGIQNNAPDPNKGNDDVYTLSLENNLEVHLIGTQENYLNTVCILPVAKEQLGEEQLHTLLSANLFSLDHPMIKVGVSQKHQLVLSSRQVISELDSAECFRHIERIIQRGQALKEWLSQPGNEMKSSENNHVNSAILAAGAR